MKKSIFLVAVLLFGTSAWQLSSAAPVLCSMIYQPVCGVNGATYSNDCEAGNSGVPVAYSGACEVRTKPPLTSLTSDPFFQLGTPFRSIYEQKRVDAYVRQYITQLATYKPPVGQNLTVTNIDWTNVAVGSVQTFAVSYRDNSNHAYTERFVQQMKSRYIWVYPLLSPGTNFTFWKGQQGFVPNNNMIVALTDLSDSTCPPNVQCVWAGEKVLQMTYKQGSEVWTGKNLLTAFQSQLSIIGTDYHTWATLAIH